MYTYTGACTLGETRVSSESVAKSRSRSDKARGYARRDPLRDDGRRCRDLLFPFLPTFCDPKYFKTGSYKKKLWLKVSHIGKNKQ